MVNGDMVKMMEGSEGAFKLIQQTKHQLPASAIVLDVLFRRPAADQPPAPQAGNQRCLTFFTAVEDLQIPYVCSPWVPA